MARPRNDAAPDLSTPANFTVGLIARLRCPDGKQQAFLRDAALAGLKVRVTPAGAKSFVFERELAGKGIRITIGSVDSWSIEQARTEARRLAVLMDQGIDPRERAREQRAKVEAERVASVEASQYTLAALLDAYCDHQQVAGRQSHRDARTIFKLHVVEAWPKVAAIPAKDVTEEQIADAMRRLIEAGKGRSANKLRSYLRAAFQMAKAAKSKPSIPVAFKAFNVTRNPAADVEPDSAANRADRNPLTAEQLRDYWQILESTPSLRGAALRLHLLTGGQRVAQLARLRTADATSDRITLLDGKGRPGHEPRVHTLPLTVPAAKALAECQPAGDYALSTSGGRDHISADSLSRWASDAVGDRIPGFTLKRVRSGVETLLAAGGVSQDIRGRLQSHGIHGVQARHYDGHDYLAEKLAALETLYRLITQTSSDNVRSIRRHGAAGM